MKIALNGLGRIGKLVLREVMARKLDETHGIELVLLNDAVGDAEMHAHLLEFDTVHGRAGMAIGHGPESLILNGRQIRLTRESTIEALPLAALGVEMVVDCTGVFKTVAKTAPYFEAGTAKVLVSAPIKEEGALNLVYGVNHDLYDASRHRLVTAASCTTNCLAPVVKVIHEGIGIRHGTITTIHDVTNTQTIVDRPAKDLRRARSAINSLIPTTTGSAKAIGAIFPELEGRLNGHAIRVPLLTGSLTDCVFEVARPVSAEEVNGLLKAAADGPLHGILGYESRPLVSSDYVNDPRSSIVDAPSTMVVGDSGEGTGTQVKIYAWYDNEMGYAHRMVDLMAMMASASTPALSAMATSAV
ncbi:MAG: ArsJ-associated glyceraldehyde-3-phosphate dehydrogenase [Pseudomonadota bacterium]